MDDQKSLYLDLLEELSPPPLLPGELDTTEPEVWPDPPPPTDWLGLQELVAGEVTRVYEGEPAPGPLPARADGVGPGSGPWPRSGSSANRGSARSPSGGKRPAALVASWSATAPARFGSGIATSTVSSHQVTFPRENVTGRSWHNGQCRHPWWIAPAPGTGSGARVGGLILAINPV